MDERLCFLFGYLVTSYAIAASPTIAGVIVKETGALIWNEGKDI